VTAAVPTTTPVLIAVVTLAPVLLTSPSRPQDTALRPAPHRQLAAMDPGQLRARPPQ
jgi:hypothetical protein